MPKKNVVDMQKPTRIEELKNVSRLLWHQNNYLSFLVHQHTEEELQDIVSDRSMKMLKKRAADISYHLGFSLDKEED